VREHIVQEGEGQGAVGRGAVGDVGIGPGRAGVTVDAVDVQVVGGLFAGGDLGVGAADAVQGLDVVAREGVVVPEQVVVDLVKEGLALHINDVGPQQNVVLSGLVQQDGGYVERMG